MKTIFVLIILLVLPAVSCGYQTTASCGASYANFADVDVLLRYTSLVNTQVASPVFSTSLPATGAGVYAYYLLRGKADASGDVFITLSSGVAQVVSCHPYSSTFSFNLLMGFAGALCAGMLFYSILSAYLN